MTTRLVFERTSDRSLFLATQQEADQETTEGRDIEKERKMRVRTRGGVDEK